MRLTYSSAILLQSLLFAQKGMDTTSYMIFPFMLTFK